jgi:hypothetical protein
MRFYNIQYACARSLSRLNFVHIVNFKEIKMKLAIKNAVLAVALVGVYGTANATALVANVPTANVDIVHTFFGGSLLDSASTNISNISYNGVARTAVYDTGSGLDFYH